MSALPDDKPLPNPYRAAPHVAPMAPPSPWRVLSLVSFALSTLALLVTLTSLQLTASLVGFVRAESARRSLIDLRRRAPPGAPAVDVARPAPPPPVEVAAPPPPLAEGIRDVGRGVYVVTRGAIDTALNGNAALMRRTTIVPETHNGRVVGVRVFGIRPGDVLDLLGFENGDVLRAVNGVDVASPDRCLEAYASARRTDRVEVAFERRGVPRSHVYAIVAGR